jgi:hypothetical protein
MEMSAVYRGRDNDGVNLKYWEKKQCHCQFFHHKSNMYWPRIEHVRAMKSEMEQSSIENYI